MSESEDVTLVCCADALTTAPEAASMAAPPGLDVLEPLNAKDEDPPRDPAPLLGLIVEVETTRRGQVPVPAGANPVLVDRVWLEDSLRPVMLAAAEEARDSRRSVESAGAPIAFVDAAIRKLQKASDAYDRAHGQQGFKEATFKFKLKKLAKHLEDLQKKAGGV